MPSTPGTGAPTGWLDCRWPLGYACVQLAVRDWQPFAGFVYFHLLLANLAEHGTLTERSSAAHSSPRH